MATRKSTKGTKSLTKAEALDALEKAETKVRGIDAALRQATESMATAESVKRVLRDLCAEMGRYRAFTRIRAALPKQLLNDVRAACSD